MYKLSYVASVTGIDSRVLKELLLSGAVKGMKDDSGFFIEQSSMESYLLSQKLDVPDVLKTGRVSMLIVDDDENMVKTLKRLFMQVDNLVIETAVNPYEMGYRLNTVKPKIIILDYNMPGMNGKKVVEELTKERCFAGMNIIIFTGGDLYEISEEFKGYENVSAVSKTSDYQVLVNRVKDLMNK